jgi:hypothetical protein
MGTLHFDELRFVDSRTADTLPSGRLLRRAEWWELDCLASLRRFIERPHDEDVL